MDKSKNVIWMSEIYRSRNRSNNSDIITLVNRFLAITRKEWLSMNEARDIDYMDTAYEGIWDISPTRAGSTEIIPLISKNKHLDKSVAESMMLEILNERLYFFYNDGGPIMEL